MPQIEQVPTSPCERDEAMVKANKVRGTVYGYVKGQFIGMVNLEHENAINRLKARILEEHQHRSRFLPLDTIEEQKKNIEASDRERLRVMHERFESILKNYDQLSIEERAACFAFVRTEFWRRHVRKNIVQLNKMLKITVTIFSFPGIPSP